MRCRVKLTGNNVFKTNIVSDITLQNKFSFIRKIANILIRKISKTVSCKKLLLYMNMNCQKMKDKIAKSATVKLRRSPRKKEATNSDTSLLEGQNITKKAGKNHRTRSMIRTIKKKRCIEKIKQLRNLKHYKEIEAFWNTGKKILGKDKIESLNYITPKNKNNSIYWCNHAYIVRQIEHCIFKQNWNNLTKFLIVFANFQTPQKQFLMQASLINFVVNPVSQKNEMLKDFLKGCFSCRDEKDIRQLLTDYFHFKHEETE